MPHEDMGEPHRHRALFYLIFISLRTGVKCDMLASLAPPVHLSGERLGWTLLFCMVRNFRRGRLEISWRSPSEGRTSSGLVRFSSKHLHRSAVAGITVATKEWTSYSCSVSRHPRVSKRHHITNTDAQDIICNGNDESKDVAMWTNTVIVFIMRLLLLKSLVLNSVVTMYAVRK
ncbi:uncharacterized protein LOC144049413 [Vanacampus margaritifer]